jgi:hypothetical protein
MSHNEKWTQKQKIYDGFGISSCLRQKEERYLQKNQRPQTPKNAVHLSLWRWIDTWLSRSRGGSHKVTINISY